MHKKRGKTIRADRRKDRCTKERNILERKEGYKDIVFSFFFPFCLCIILRYDQYEAEGEEREDIRKRFEGVIEFVENYLHNISSNIWSFSDKEQNKLTYEVSELI